MPAGGDCTHRVVVYWRRPTDAFIY